MNSDKRTKIYKRIQDRIHSPTLEQFLPVVPAENEYLQLCRDLKKFIKERINTHAFTVKEVRYDPYEEQWCAVFELTFEYLNATTKRAAPYLSKSEAGARGDTVNDLIDAIYRLKDEAKSFEVALVDGLKGTSFSHS